MLGRHFLLRLAISVAVVSAALVTAPAARAHKLRTVRSLMVEPWDDGHLHVIARLRVPGGHHRRAMYALADTNVDGKLSTDEHEQLKRVLAARALSGIELRVESSTTAIRRVATKLQVDESASGAIEIMVHGTVAFGARDDRFSVHTAPGSDPLRLEVLPGKRPVVTSSRGRLRAGGFAADLSKTDTVSWRLQPVRRAKPPEIGGK